VEKSAFKSGPTIFRLLNLYRENPLSQRPSSSNPEKKLPLTMSENNGDRLIVFDTGALIQLHTQERFHTLSRQVYVQAKQIGICNLAIPELAGATGAMVRSRRISPKQRHQIQNFVFENQDSWLIIPVSKRVCDLAFDLCQTHPIKGADAIHLAATKIMATFRQLLFFTFDKQLYNVAQKEKLPLVTIPEFESGR
jgi:predicted nucleic acid-binding protein